MGRAGARLRAEYRVLRGGEGGREGVCGGEEGASLFVCLRRLKEAKVVSCDSTFTISECFPPEERRGALARIVWGTSGVPVSSQHPGY